MARREPLIRKYGSRSLIYQKWKSSKAIVVSENGGNLSKGLWPRCGYKRLKLICPRKRNRCVPKFTAWVSDAFPV
jgi:hypothetical protein